MKKYIFLIISIFWTLVILSFSTQSGEVSGSISYDLTLYIYQFVRSILPNLEVDTLHLVIRKCAHVGEYAILGIMYGLSGKQFNLKYYFILFLGLAVALIDEGVQFFSIDRGPSIIDALIFDFPGFMIGLIIVTVIHKRMNKF